MDGITLTATKPRYLTGMVLLLWGWQADFIPAALIMISLIEGRYFFKRRWALEKQDFYRVADLTAVAFVGLLVYLFNNALTNNLIVSLLQWLPLLFFPLVIVLAFSTSERMTLDVLFYSLRRQREPVTQSWDMDYLLVFVCLAGIGASPEAVDYFLLAITVTTVFLFYPLKPLRYSGLTWLLVAAITVTLAAGSAWLFRSSHVAFKEASGKWLARWIQQRTDPLKTRTAIGRLGELKLSDTIRFRVEPLNSSSVPKLLVEAVYDMPSENDWMAMSPDYQILPHSDDFHWIIGSASSQDESMNIYHTFERKNDLLPIPSSITQVTNLPAVDIRQSRYGTLQGTELLPSPLFNIHFRGGSNIYSNPDSSELYVPSEVAKIFDNMTAFDSTNSSTTFSSEQEKVDFVRHYFSSFRYSLYPGLTEEHPLKHFLEETKAGHCELFASSTAMMLRHLGIPTRYAVGFAVQEWNEQLGMFLVRERHRHAWTLAFVDDQWQVVDTTPSIWAATEAELSSPLRPVLDFFANQIFVFSIWWNKQKLEDYEIELYILGALLTAFLVWRLARSEQVLVKTGSEQEDLVADEVSSTSPFQAVISYLENEGFQREPGERAPPWLKRIQHNDLLPLVNLHYQWRFDFNAMSPSEKQNLSEEVNKWLEAKAPDFDGK